VNIVLRNYQNDAFGTNQKRQCSISLETMPLHYVQSHKFNKEHFTCRGLVMFAVPIGLQSW